MCSDGWDLEFDDGIESNGTCPVCGEDTFDGEAMVGCNYSPVDCDLCGSAPCDQSC